MKEYVLNFNEGIKKGITPTEKNAYNNEGFLDMSGAFQNDGLIQSVEKPEWIELSSLDVEFPFPQVFELIGITLVCTPTRVYELLADNSLDEKISTSEGGLWSVADYHLFIVLTNGRQIIIRDGQSGEWRVYDECEIPTGICVCNLNGQLIIGGPETQVSAGFRG